MIAKNLNDQTGKEEKHHVEQQGDNLFKISSTNKIAIKELKIIDEITLEDAILSNPAFN